MEVDSGAAAAEEREQKRRRTSGAAGERERSDSGIMQAVNSLLHTASEMFGGGVQTEGAKKQTK